MDDVYEQLVHVTMLQIKQCPEINDDQLDGYVKYLGVFVPKMREKIIKDARSKLKK